MLYTLLLMPIQLLFELVFSYAYRISGERTGLAIIALSLAINLLILPLYRRADAMQEEERIIEQKLRPGVDHIKKTFRGNERTMMLQTYYRQNNYSPLYVLRSAVSLLLEIPFFIAAYRFLSGLSLMQGVSFGPITDLGSPDGLIRIGELSINVLPVLMTAINVISTIIFTKGYPLKSKIQLYGMAVLFLVLLYDSPSGLVFYWTLNNLFSLIKTIFYKIKNPKKVLRILLLAIGCTMVLFGVFDYLRNTSVKRLILFSGFGIALCIPFILIIFKRKGNSDLLKIKATPNIKIFWCGSVFLTVLTGILIPSAVIHASPQEFVLLGSSFHPVWYIVGSLLIATGTFVLWMGVFYWLFSPKVKVVFERVLIILCGVGLIDYLFFGNDLGRISAELVYDNGISFSSEQVLINAFVVLLIIASLIVMTRLSEKMTQGLVWVTALTMLCMSVINIAGIFTSVSETNQSYILKNSESESITLSKTEKNVVVLMLDRSMGEYFPYILYQYPKLKEFYSGFTYYSNTISFGTCTNIALPALFGGYEYTPAEINKRDSDTLESKHNESLKVMPVLFSEAGYNVTVCDPTYAGYTEIPDLSIYDGYDNINACISQDDIYIDGLAQEVFNNRYTNFFSYSMVKISPLKLQPLLYDNGYYHRVNPSAISTKNQGNYDQLINLSSFISVSDNEKGSFVMFTNSTAHKPTIFEDSDFLQAARRDDNETITDCSITLNGKTLIINNSLQLGNYHANIAALMRIGEWLDYLKAEGVYDNTRIIIAADHGYSTLQMEEFLLDSSEKTSAENYDLEYYFPLLLVKDFDTNTELTTSDEFMTNADVPVLAMNGIINDPVNPFTGKTISNSEKSAHDQYVFASGEWSIEKNNGNTFLPANWFSVHDSIWDKNNWKIVAENSVLP